jgi:multidrug resistance efflux pump
MRSLAPLLLLPILFLAAAFRGQPEPGGPEAGVQPSLPRPGSEHVVVSRVELPQRFEFQAVLVPVEASELGFWPRSGGPELVFELVREHGTLVNEGDVVASLDSAELARQVVRSQAAIRAAELSLRGLTERAGLAQASAEVARAGAERALAQASEDLARWSEHELAALERGDQLATQAEQHGIDDAQDELTQLELMYADDELIQATEEIVLRRSRRNLSFVRSSVELNRQRRGRAAGLRVRTTEAKERAVVAARVALAALEVEHKLGAAVREQGLSAGRAALEAARDLHARQAEDLEGCSLRAPRSGVVLHGSLAQWNTGQRAQYRRGERAPARQGLFLVADPDRLGAVFELPAGEREQAPHGTGVRLKPTGSAAEALGLLEVGRYPTPSGALPARVVLERPFIGQTAGSPAMVVIEGASRRALLLPEACINGVDDARWCWMALEGGDYRRVPVQVLGVHGSQLEVEGDLPDGTRVLLPWE